LFLLALAEHPAFANAPKAFPLVVLFEAEPILFLRIEQVEADGCFFAFLLDDLRLRAAI
jgi:hypothetical protein